MWHYVVRYNCSFYKIDILCYGCSAAHCVLKGTPFPPANIPRPTSTPHNPLQPQPQRTAAGCTQLFTTFESTATMSSTAFLTPSHSQSWQNFPSTRLIFALQTRKGNGLNTSSPLRSGFRTTPQGGRMKAKVTTYTAWTCKSIQTSSTSPYLATAKR